MNLFRGSCPKKKAVFIDLINNFSSMLVALKQKLGSYLVKLSAQLLVWTIEPKVLKHCNLSIIKQVKGTYLGSELYTKL